MADYLFSKKTVISLPKILLVVQLLSAILSIVFQDVAIPHGGRSFPIGIVVMNVICLLVAFPEGMAASLIAGSLAYALEQLDITPFFFELFNGPFLGVFAALIKAISVCRNSR